jgi:hypothetical protein
MGFLFASLIALAAPTLTLEGACPGVAEITIAGLTPGGEAALVSGMPGSSVLPGGPCAGLETGLDRVRPEARLRDADGDGRVSVAPTLPDRACEGSIQAVDLSACTLSGVVALDGSDVCDEGAATDGPAVCPAACTGGCDGATCIMDCTRTSACQVTTLDCPDGMNCEIRCWGQSACQASQIYAPVDGTLDLQCSGLSACQAMDVFGNNGATNVSCSFTSTCQLGEVTCGSGPCRTDCTGISAGLSAKDCGDSCDCTDTCL